MAEPRRLAMVVGAGLGCVLASGLYALHAVGDEPHPGRGAGSCNACHTMQPARESWAADRHRAVTDCLDCHLPHAQPARFVTQISSGLSHIFHESLDEPGSPLRLRVASRDVVEANCARCHPDSEAPAGTAASRARCTHCHPREGHR